MCVQMEFFRGRGSTLGEVHIAGEVVVQSLFVLSVVLRCVCIVERRGEMVQWPWGG